MEPFENSVMLKLNFKFLNILQLQYLFCSKDRNSQADKVSLTRPHKVAVQKCIIYKQTVTDISS